MQYTVEPLTQIDFGATGVKEVLQNVAFILSTPVYSCPMDRAFGWIPDLDSPINVAAATNEARMIQAIQVNEPRAIVEQVIIKGKPLDGNVKAIVRVEIDESI